MKKLLIGFAILLALLLGSLIAIPYFFKDEILAAVKSAANESLEATLEFKDLDISAFRHFPKLSVGLEGLDITGNGHFDGVKLVQCKRLDLAVDLWSAIFSDNVVIKGLYFIEPDIRVFVLSNGDANYNITKADPNTPAETSSSSGGNIKLERYAIEGGKLLYDDRSLDMRMEIEGLEHSGSGDLGADVYDLVMKTAVEKLSVNYGGMQYLSRARADWAVTLGADMKNMKFTFKDNKMKVNDLELDLNGWFQMPNETDYLMDLSFGTPANTFKSLLSIIPGAYTQDFASVQANGTVQFGGFLKGKYNEKTYPSVRLDLKVGNADFKYPALPLGVSNINVDMTIFQPTERLNDMRIDIPSFALRIGSNPLEGYFHLKTPESDPTIDTKINGTLNLAELTKAFPVADVKTMAGIIKANITMKAAMSQIDQAQYDKVQMAGDFDMQNITYEATDMPPVKINSLRSSLSPQRVVLENFDAKLGKSDLKASGAIDNILAYFSTEKTMTGSINMQSFYFDANEWMETPESATAADSKVPNDVAPADEKVFDRWDFVVDGSIGRLKYDVYDISDMVVKGHLRPNNMDISEFSLKMGESDLRGNGKILNAWNYMFDNQTVAGTVNLQSSYFDLNPFMEETPATTTASTAAAAPVEAVIPVPENMDMTINANFARVKYTNLTLDNLDGQIVVKDEVAAIKNCTANVLGGQIALDGDYDTRDLSKPAYDMNLALQNMGFRDAFQNFTTVKTLAPIAQLMNGNFNTTLSMNGLLGKDMTPDFNTLSMSGFLETIAATLSGFKGLTEISNKLNVDYLKSLDLGNTKNWFEVKNGTVNVKPFDVKMKDVAMKIGGSHSIANEMNYQILTKAPRKVLGSAGNAGLNYLSGEASKYGVSLAQGEYINVRFDLTGSLFNPKVGFKVLGSDGESSIQEQAGASMQAAIDKTKDSLANVANRELEKAKEKATQAAEKAADSLSKVANRELEKAKEKAAQEAKDQVGKVLGSEAGNKAGEKVGEKAGEVLGDKGQKSVEEAKKKLETWDPFKKKKNNN
jgi:hypothetical protein